MLDLANDFSLEIANFIEFESAVTGRIYLNLLKH
jgi:hypothetical protein